MEVTHGDLDQIVVLHLLAVQFKCLEAVLLLDIDDLEAPGQLVEFAAVVRIVDGFVPEHEQQGIAELPARKLELHDLVVIREDLAQVAFRDDLAQFLAADRAAGNHDEIDAGAFLDDVREQVAELGIPVPAILGVHAVEPRQDLLIDGVRDGFVVLHHLFQFEVPRTVLLRDGNEFPGIGGDGIRVRVDDQVEAADLVRADGGLDDGYAGHHGRLVDQGVRVATDNQVDAPVRIQPGGQFLVVLETDMRQQDRQVDVHGLVGHADASHFLGRVLDADERTDQLLVARVLQDVLGQDADEHDLHPVYLDDPVGVEEAGAVAGQEHVGVDDRELGAFLQEQEMGESVIHFMVAQRHHVGRQQVHDLDGRDAPVFLIDQGSFEHVTGDGVQDVPLFLADLGYVTGQHGHAAGQLLVHLLGQEISM